jgi:hypothetical protein
MTFYKTCMGGIVVGTGVAGALLEWTTKEANLFTAIGARSAQIKALTVFSKRGLRSAIREVLASLKSSDEHGRIISEQASTAQEAYPATTAWAS